MPTGANRGRWTRLLQNLSKPIESTTSGLECYSPLEHDMHCSARLVESLGRLALKGQLPGAELDISRPTGFRPDAAWLTKRMRTQHAERCMPSVIMRRASAKPCTPRPETKPRCLIAQKNKRNYCVGKTTSTAHFAPCPLADAACWTGELPRRDSNSGR